MLRALSQLKPKESIWFFFLCICINIPLEKKITLGWPLLFKINAATTIYTMNCNWWFQWNSIHGGSFSGDWLRYQHGWDAQFSKWYRFLWHCGPLLCGTRIYMINYKESNPIGKKLDQALINPAWLSIFSHSHAYFEAGGISDHRDAWFTYLPPMWTIENF